MTQKEGNVRKSDTHLSSRDIVRICQTMSNVQIYVIFMFRNCYEKPTKNLEIEWRCNYNVVNFFVPSTCYMPAAFYSISTFFWEEGLSFIYVRFQTNDSMSVPEIHLMRIVAWLIRRKGEPDRLIIWRKPETILLSAIKLKTEQYYDKERNMLHNIRIIHWNITRMSTRFYMSC